jgi:transposase-like protein
MNNSKTAAERYIPPTPTETQMYWFRQLQQHQSSGLSLAEYAKQQGLSKHTLHFWSQLLRIPKAIALEDHTPLFQVVHLEPAPSPVAATGITLVLRLPSRIECELHFDHAQACIEMVQSLARLTL